VYGEGRGGANPLEGEPLGEPKKKRPLPSGERVGVRGRKIPTKVVPKQTKSAFAD
jgi:hypothetical protein